MSDFRAVIYNLNKIIIIRFSSRGIFYDKKFGDKKNAKSPNAFVF